MPCGVLGVVLKSEEDDLRPYARVGLGALNHRGEDSHGAIYINPRKELSEPRKELGLVRDSGIFKNKMIGSMLIGHTRYITSSQSTIYNTQPIDLKSESGLRYAISHNGNIANDRELKSILRIEEQGISDTRVLGTMLGSAIGKQGEELQVSMRDLLSKATGSYSFAILVEGEHPKVIAARDRFGYMPLFLGQNAKGFFIASEPVAFTSKHLDATYRPVAPGEMLVIDQKEVVTYQLYESSHKQHCMFQWVYMCRPDSDFEGANVYEVRDSIGASIAKNYRPNVDFVVPVPDSGLAVAYGYSNASGKPIKMGVVKDRYETKRSFMQGDHSARADVVNKKLNVVAQIVSGKSILLMDDSIVRSITMMGLVKELRDAGAREVHVALSCPPIISQCHFGIDFYNKDLVARPFKDLSHEEMNRSVAVKIGADSIYYPTIQDLVGAIGIKERDLCLSCLTGNYAQQIPNENEQSRKS